MYVKLPFVYAQNDGLLGTFEGFAGRGFYLLLGFRCAHFSSASHKVAVQSLELTVKIVKIAVTVKTDAAKPSELCIWPAGVAI